MLQCLCNLEKALKDVIQNSRGCTVGCWWQEMHLVSKTSCSSCVQKTWGALELNYDRSTFLKPFATIFVLFLHNYVQRHSHRNLNILVWSLWKIVPIYLCSILGDSLTVLHWYVQQAWQSIYSMDAAHQSAVSVYRERFWW